MILGLAVFLGAHTLTTQRELRARLIGSIGEAGYKAGYAVVSLVGLVLIVWGFAHYRAAGLWPVWSPPTALKHLNTALMLPAVILVVAAYIRGRIYTAVKHPMLSGVKLWAFGHLLANGDVCLVMGWAGDVTLARDRAKEAGRGNELAYSIPKEGTIMSLDMLAVVGERNVNASTAQRLL